MQTSPQSVNRSRIYLLFVGMAALTMLAFALSFGLFHSVASLHEASVRLNRANSERLGRLERLQQLAAMLNAPGNDIFVSGNVEKERDRVVAAATAIRREAASLGAELSRAGQVETLASLDAAAVEAAAVERDAHRVLNAFWGKDLAAAARAMARMDQNHARVLEKLDKAADSLRAKETAALLHGEREFNRIRRQEQVIGVVLVLLIALLLFFAYRAAREVVSSRERQQYLEQLKEREASLRETVQERDRHARSLEEAQSIAKLGSWEWDVRADTITWSDELHRIFGTSPESFEGTLARYMERVPPEDRPRLEQSVEEAMQNRSSYEIEHRLVRTDGEMRILSAKGNVECDADGNVIRMYGVAHDVSSLRASEEQLRKSEERFKMAARAANDVIWDWDLVTNALWMGEGWAQQFGHSEAVSIDAWAQNIHPADADRIASSLHEALESSESAWSGEYRLRTAAGSYRTVVDRGMIVRDSSSKAIRMIGAMVDITERKKSEIEVVRLHRKTELILGAVADGLFDLDLDGVSTFVNPAAAHALGYEPDELVGKQMHTVIHYKHEDGTEYPWEECPECLTLKDGLGRSATTVFWSKSGKAVPVEFTATAIVDDSGNVVGAVKTFRDITHRRLVDKMKDEFVSTVSHELRTPLTSIRGALGLLVSGRLGELPEKAGRLLEIASTNTDRLVRLINDILDIERMESGKVTLTKVPTDASELVQQAADGMRQLADQARISIAVNATPTPVVADPDRLVQTLTNLIGNAIKFSPSGSTITVSAETADGAVVFRVADRGRGIPKDKLDTVFERFKQVDASDSRDKGGSGLGLSICRSIVRQHGGKMSVQSDVGKGSEFVFTIPLPEAPAPAPALVLPDFRPRQRRVFICDDEVGARDVMSVLLTSHGYLVDEFESGEELVAGTALRLPDLILLDLFMPDMNGWEALARLKTDPRTASIPVVVVSILSPADCDSPFADLCGWLRKPLEEDELLRAVRNALGSDDRPRQILVVEDDTDLARVIASSFERFGVEVIIASSGAQAIDVASTMTPDLVVLDLMLPQVDGFGVVDWIKERGLWSDVPMIVYSALETTPSQQQRLRLGPTEFITKSRIGPEEFEMKVLQLLDRLTEEKPLGPLVSV